MATKVEELLIRLYEGREEHDPSGTTSAAWPYENGQQCCNKLVSLGYVRDAYPTGFRNKKIRAELTNRGILKAEKIIAARSA